MRATIVARWWVSTFLARCCVLCAERPAAGRDRQKIGSCAAHHVAREPIKGDIMRGKQILITAAVSLAVVIGYQTYLARKAG